MIIQRVIKGIGGIDTKEACAMARHKGIWCNWWRTQAQQMPVNAMDAMLEVEERLNSRNLDWHQNRYDDRDPQTNDTFSRHTPFISTTAGTVVRDLVYRTNMIRPAWIEALRFATNFWRRDGYLFYCYVYVLGRPSAPLRGFGEELRELNIYTRYSPFQPEGEITAKLHIPAVQIEKVEFWPLEKLLDECGRGEMPQPAPIDCPEHTSFVDPSIYNNVRDVLI